MIARIRSALAWHLFQSRVRKARLQAVASHAPRREIDARQRAVVNAALRGGR